MPGALTQVVLVDTVGELAALYAAADVAFVGGSLVPIGGHNVLEPAALSVPVIVGPQTFNFTDITASLIEAGAALCIADGDALGAMVIRLLAKLSRRFTNIIYNSRRSARQHEELGYDTSKTQIIFNGVDTQSFTPSDDARRAIRAELGLPQDALLVRVTH